MMLNIVFFFLSGRSRSNAYTFIYLQEGRFYAKDMGSTNGTFLNGKKLLEKPVRLKDGDKIKIGNVEFMFVDPYVMEVKS